MARIKNTERGKAGELLAETFLIGAGIKVLCKNYRYKRAEIDLVATNEKELIIVEVKMRQSNSFGYPEEFISTYKQQLIKKAAYHYKEENNLELPIRFDVIAISIDEKEIKHFIDAF